MSIFFDFAYALVILVAFALVGLLPGCLLGFVVPHDDRRLLVPGAAVALAGWIWFGWLGARYGVSRIGLVIFAAFGAAGFVRGWWAGLRAGRRARARCSHTRASPR